ncbi:MAG: RNHCP domain-containing protein [Defluviitaleaceae bacterium]|nr:RNHCP domain-containing protein [Defluviitaleaceae bacterium]MCL2837211.1 RNHCP domain-containing protein [Defluviitaleaceae bacterium]
MNKKSENTGFTCEKCGRDVLRLERESYRNHCPFCLYSKHVDVEPGDRLNECGGLMAPVGARLSAKGAQVLHKCGVCGFARYNLITDDSRQPDDYDLFLTVMKESAL